MDPAICDPVIKGQFYKKTTGKQLFGSQDMTKIYPKLCYNE